MNGIPVVLLYGATPAWRTLSEGVTGPDVEELNADLVDLGYATSSELSPSSDYFGSATLSAVEALQTHLGVPATGSLTFGQVAFLPTAVRVTAVPATLGAPAEAGSPVVQATSTTREVTATLDATQVSQVRAGDVVSISLPDHRTTSGTIASVGTTATAPSSDNGDGGNGASGPPTVQVDVTPTDPAATGVVDQAPVTVTVTTSGVRSVLAVPITALVTTGGDHPALDVVGAGGRSRVVPVSVGLIDDAKGLVQVRGSGLAAGQHVLLPGQVSPT